MEAERWACRLVWRVGRRREERSDERNKNAIIGPVNKGRARHGGRRLLESAVGGLGVAVGGDQQVGKEAVAGVVRMEVAGGATDGG